MAVGPSGAGSEPVVLVLRALGLGDLLTAVPALRGVRAALPTHRLVLAGPAPLVPLARLTGVVDDVLPADGLEPLQEAGSAPDVAVNLHGRGPQSHRVLQAVRPGRLVAFGEPVTGVTGPAWREGEHEVARWCRLVAESSGVACPPDALDLHVPSEAPAVAGAVIIHPGAAFESRRWPVERFAAVARALSARWDSPVVVTGGPSERVAAERVAALAGLPPSSVLAGRTDTVALAALVASARLVVCGDTGVAHLATAYRAPSVVLFGPVSPQRWGPPPRPQHRVLWRGDGTGDPWADDVDPALVRLGVDDVLRACEEVLARADAPGRAASGG